MMPSALESMFYQIWSDASINTQNKLAGWFVRARADRENLPLEHGQAIILTDDYYNDFAATAGSILETDD